MAKGAVPLSGPNRPSRCAPHLITQRGTALKCIPTNRPYCSICCSTEQNNHDMCSPLRCQVVPPNPRNRAALPYLALHRKQIPHGSTQSSTILHSRQLVLSASPHNFHHDIREACAAKHDNEHPQGLPTHALRYGRSSVFQRAVARPSAQPRPFAAKSRPWARFPFV